MTAKVSSPLSLLLLMGLLHCSSEKAPPGGAGGSNGTGGASVGQGGAMAAGGNATLGGSGANFGGATMNGGAATQGGNPIGAGGAAGGTAPAQGGNAAGGASGGAAGNAAAAGSGGGAVASFGGTAGASGAGGGPNGGAAGSASTICPAGPFSATPIAKGMTAMRIAGAPPSDAFNNQGNDFAILEGPVWREGALYFSEFGSGATPNSRVLRVALDGQVSIAIPDAGTNGLALDNSGELLGASHKIGGIVRLSLTGAAATTLVSEFMGQRFNSPNDIAVRRDGNIYFTDPGYQAPSQRPQSATRVYRILPNATTATAIIADRQDPNGIALSPDGNTLYVGGGDGVFSHPVMADGTVGTGTRFTGTSTDGMGVDCAGNLYLTSNADVVAVSPTGTELGRLTVSGIQSVTNVAFGGADRKTLYITSLGSGTQRGVFRAELANPGFPY